MALVPSLKVRLPDPVPADVSDALEALQQVADRLGHPVGWLMRSTDANDIDRAFGLAVAMLRRWRLSSPISIHRHNCPHVAGQEEPTWTACTSPQYGFEEVVI